MSQQVALEQRKMLTVGEIEFEDQLLNLFPVNEEVKEFFTVEDQGLRPQSEDHDTILFQVRYQMNPSQRSIKRSVYNILEWLGDIGGLNDALFFFSYLIMYLFQISPIKLSLLRQLYSMRPASSIEDPLSLQSFDRNQTKRKKIKHLYQLDNQSQGAREELKLTYLSYVKFLVIDQLPKFCRRKIKRDCLRPKEKAYT